MSDIIDRLQSVIDYFNHGSWQRKYCIEIRYEIERLRQCIEELEEERNQLRQFQQSLHPTGLRDYMKTYYVITDAQIDAAWAQGFDALAELGIVRCEECGGSGEGGMRYDGSPVPVEENCHDCNGHGWVKEAKDE